MPESNTEMKSSGYATVPDHICPTCGSNAGFITEARGKAIDYKGHIAVIPTITLRYCTMCGEGFDIGCTDMQRMADTLQNFMCDVDAST
jgi:YgiT-type zinc finger domain-containing protein